MATSHTTLTFAGLLDGLVAEALKIDVTPETAEKARAATARAMRIPAGAPATIAVKRRAQAYFSAVIRRSTVRGTAGGRATARLVVAAVVADLEEAGRSGADIWRELERGWSERLPDDLMDEYRTALCAGQRTYAG